MNYFFIILFTLFCNNFTYAASGPERNEGVNSWSKISSHDINKSNVKGVKLRIVQKLEACKKSDISFDGVLTDAKVISPSVPSEDNIDDMTKLPADYKPPLFAFISQLTRPGDCTEKKSFLYKSGKYIFHADADGKVELSINLYIGSELDINPHNEPATKGPYLLVETLN